MNGSFFDRFRRGGKQTSDEKPPLLPDPIWPMVEIWLAQAASLHELRQYDVEKRKLNVAASAAFQRLDEQPKSTDAWFCLGRIYLAGKEPEKAKQAFQMLQELAVKSGNALLAKQAFDEQSRAGLLQVAIDQSLKDNVIESIVHTCQACGHLILFIGSHCPHCRFAPSNEEEVAIGSILSTAQCHVPTLLQISREIQKGRKPMDFIPELADEVSKPPEGHADAVLSKLRRRAADDHLDFRSLEACPQCDAISNPSWVRECHACKTPLNRPELLELLICISHLLQHLVWNIRRDTSEAFSYFVILLVNLWGRTMRHQAGPTDAERKWVHRLLVEISPIWTENRGGLIEVYSVCHIQGKVVDLSVNPKVGLTVDHLEAELRNFARLTSDQTGLF